jgi:NAD(P)H dehydrogenase (quinone)
MLIIYAHPNKDGHCGQILKNVITILEERKQDYTLVDLYKKNYDPVMKNEEHYTSGHYKVSDKNKELQNLIKQTRKFIIIYPTWWNNVPAILKGFFDRVLVNKFAFEYKHGIPCGLLKGRALVITSTGGPKFAYSLIQKKRSLKVVTSDTLRFCGLKSKGFVITRALKLNDKQKNKIEKTVQNGLKYLKI